MAEVRAARPTSLWVWSLLLACGSIAVFAGARDHYLTLDSVPIVGMDARIAAGQWGSLATGDWWNLSADDSTAARPSLWRPLTKLWFAAWHPGDGVLRGSDARLFGVMLGNVLLHAVLCVLRFRLLVALLPTGRSSLAAAWIAAFALAVHPVHTESVGTAVGAADSLAAVLVCGALLLQVRTASATTAWIRMLNGLLVLLALCAKESAVVAPACALLVALAQGRSWRQSVLAAVPASLALACFLVLRTAVLGETLGVSDPVFALFGSHERIATALAVVTCYDLQALLCPFWLNPNLTLQDVAPAASLADPRAALGAAILLGFAVTAWLCARRGQKLAACGIVLFLAGMFPVSNLPFSIGAVGATRFLVLPLLGYGMVLAALSAWLLQHEKLGTLGRGLSFAVIVVVPLSATVRELPRWRNDATLFGSMNERGASMFAAYNLGVLAMQTGQSAAAIGHFERALSLDLPRVPSSGLIQEDLLESSFQARMNLAGLCLQSARQRAEILVAVAHYRTAAELCADGVRLQAAHPGDTNWNHLRAEALLGQARACVLLDPRAATQPEADVLLREAERLSPASPSAAGVRAWLAELRGDLAGALLIYASQAAALRSRWNGDSAARGFSREHARLLGTMRRGSEQQLLLLEVALAGRGREPADWLLQAALAAEASTEARVRELARAALGAWQADARDAPVAQRQRAAQLAQKLR